MKILYAEDEMMIQEICAMEMEAELDCKVICADDGEMAIALLKESSDYDLIVSDYNMPNKNGGELYNYIKKNCSQIPFFLTSSDSPEDHIEFASFKEDNSRNHSFKKPFDMDELFTYLQSSFSAQVPNETPEYYKVKISFFSLFNGVPANVYLRISDTKYVKIINENDLYSTETISKYIQKNILYLHVKKEGFKGLLDILKSQLRTTLEIETDNIVSKVKKEKKGISLIHNTVMAMGISEHIIEMTDMINDQSIKFIESNKKLKGLFAKLMIMGSDRYSYCQMVSYVAAGILNKMDWSSSSLLKRISFASLLQDISLEKDQLTFIATLDNMNTRTLTNDDVELVKNHPESSIKLLSGLGNFTNDIEEMILYHHERPDGTGFPNGKKHNSISQTTCVFIIACEFSRRSISCNEKLTPKDILVQMRPEYSIGNFRKPFEGLEKLL